MFRSLSTLIEVYITSITRAPAPPTPPIHDRSPLQCRGPQCQAHEPMAYRIQWSIPTASIMTRERTRAMGEPKLR